ncbi:hypothetical protein BJX64DRAFT_124073 [Aspergillus heterothallicus]
MRGQLSSELRLSDLLLLYYYQPCRTRATSPVFQRVPARGRVAVLGLYKYRSPPLILSGTDTAAKLRNRSESTQISEIKQLALTTWNAVSRVGEIGGCASSERSRSGLYLYHMESALRPYCRANDLIYCAAVGLEDRPGEKKQKSERGCKRQALASPPFSLLRNEAGRFFGSGEDSGIRELLVEVYTESLVADPLACSAGAE